MMALPQHRSTRTREPLRLLALLTDADGAGGGLAQFNRDMLDAFESDPAIGRVDVLSYARDAAPRNRRSGNVHVVASTSSRLAFAWRARRAALQLRPHAIWCGHLHLAPVAALAAAAARCEFWLTLHGIEAWPRPTGLRRWAAHRAAGFAAVSRCTRERVLAWWGNEPSAARVLGNTVAERFRPTADAAAVHAAATRWGIADRDVLLTVGRLAASERYKGHDRVIMRLATLRETFPRLSYVIAGDGDDRARLEALARAHGVADAVRFLGHVGHEDLPLLYQCARAFAMPSNGEGFGIAFLEAMACGAPAVGLSDDGSRDPLRDGDLGLVADEAGLTDALLRALGEHVARGEPLAARVRASFGRDVFARQVSQLVARMTAGTT